MVKIDLLILIADLSICFAEVICYSFQETSRLPSNPSLFFFGESVALGLLFTLQISNGTEVKFLCTPVNNIHFGDGVISLAEATHVLGCQPRPSFAANT